MRCIELVDKTFSTSLEVSVLLTTKHSESANYPPRLAPVINTEKKHDFDVYP